MPQKSATMVRKSSVVTVATMRGVTSLRIGSTPNARIASICSVTTMEPSSLAMDDALRPETMMPVSTAPSSRIMDVLTNRPVTAVAPKEASVAADWTASTPPVKNPAKITMVADPTPMISPCRIKSDQ